MNSLPPELNRLLSEPSWTLDEAAWIFTGFSIDSGPMQPIRLVDGEKIVFGSQDYRDALKEHDKILELIIKSPYLFVVRNRRSATADGETDVKKATYKKDFLIDLVTNKFNLHERVHVPWLDEAWNLGLIGGHVIGRPEVVDSGKASATSSTTASAKAEVISPKELYEVYPLAKEIRPFFMWVYNKLVEQSLTGKERITAANMLEYISMYCPHYIKHDKTEIFYWKDPATKDEEATWKINALKSFIIYHTTDPKKRK